jgi:flagellar biosynthesis protein FlhB
MDTTKYPLHFQIAIIVLTALFLWTFSIAREPRGWRRLFQSMFSKSDNFSVNRNKVIDETLKRYGIFVAMAILVTDVTCVVMMVTHPLRNKHQGRGHDEVQELELQQQEINRININNPELARQGVKIQ